MRIISNSALSIFFIAFTSTAVFAGPAPPQPSVPPPPGLPVDGGLVIMLLVALVYGLYKIYLIRFNKKTLF